jgi:hypothetical protein
MKQLISMLSILFLVLFGVLGCSENSQQSAKSLEEQPSGTIETTQAGTMTGTEAATEKAKKVIESLQTTQQGAAEETKSSE